MTVGDDKIDEVESFKYLRYLYKIDRVKTYN